MSPSPSKRKKEKQLASRQSAPEGQTTATKPPDNFCVVGIGASAGGLEAFAALLKALSPTLGMAYVLVPHLDPSRESAFTQILARSTAMPVLQVEDGMRIETDHIYVIPPNCDMTISRLVLQLSGRKDAHHTVNATIDIFLRSLAADQGKNAIGVILSGTASDGTLGLAAIKGEGGITFAQDTHSAKYDGMPASAIASGYVDFVLPPEGIAKELARIRNHPYVAGGPLEEEGGRTIDGYVAQVFHLLRRATGVDFSEYKPATIRRRIQRRMALNTIHKLSEYATFLHGNRTEVMALYHDLLINVTSFFRNPEVFDALKREVYPAILQAHRSSNLPLRLWVPGCSTGEEPYSHTISLLEFLEDEKQEIPLQVFGTDLSENAIQQARAGIYKESIEADVSPARLKRFFHRTDAGYQISKSIQDVCVFSTQNVFDDPPFSRVDLISCRNVMIYLSQSLQKRVIPIFHYALNPTGFLVIGSTEGLLGVGSELFDMVDKRQKIYRKRLVSTPMTFGFAAPSPSHGLESGEKPMPDAGKQAEAAKAPVELQREADRLLLARYAPPAVVINNEMEILQTRGRTGSYLELPHGRASLHLLKMARPGLLFELQKAIAEAQASKTESLRQNVHVESDGRIQVTTIRVLPFHNPVSPEQTLLVVFEPASKMEASAAETAPTRAAGAGARASADQQVPQLRQELAATREYLQAIIEAQEATNEELQSANEEIQSGNEELQSTNEELQTSKEELESANEELHTVNEEMQHRNDLLTQLNNDLNNLLNSVDLPIIMVAADLTLRGFTPPAGALLGLANTDVGRPLPRLKFNLEIARLDQMTLDVMRDSQTKEYEMRNDKRRYRLRITPYKTLDNRIDGAVLSIAEIEEFRKGDGARGAKAAKKAASKTSRVKKSARGK